MARIATDCQKLTPPLSAVTAAFAIVGLVVEMEVVVVQGKNKFNITCAAEESFKALKERVQEATGVSPQSQKLIFKGKERKDAESISASGMKNGDKIMLMLSEAGHKEMKEREEREARQKRVQEAAEAQKLKESHRDGGGAEAAGSNNGTSKQPSVTVIDEEGAGAEGASTVQVSRGKTRYRLLLESGMTFGALKQKLERISKVAAKEQRIIFKGKERGNDEDLAASGVKAGGKLLLLCGEGHHIQEDTTEMVKDVEGELATLEGRVSKLKSQCEHGMLDTVAASFEVGICFEGVERMQDNLLYVGPTHPLASAVTELKKRLSTLNDTLSALQQKHVVSANRR